MTDTALIGVGLYTLAEAERLVGVPAGKVGRWLRGHRAHGRQYEPLWKPEVDLGDERIYLGFRDLMEVRVAAAFIHAGLSPQKVRRAIDLAREMIGLDRPLSTVHFRTDGRTVFLRMAEDDRDRLIDLFRKQYAFREIVEPSLKHVDFGEDGVPRRWWPLGRRGHVVVDPERAFGQPIESTTSVPVASLVAAVSAEGSVEAAAAAWDVPSSAVRHALEFSSLGEMRKAA
ncbi:hypothetical protein GCM10017083_37920 [Thalassobaculum fulvum]|uniref:DUF433 domain-containing protein n=1 Tax=Thalassobaculum fulvum TaxID=1633335 RepID=A0A918XUG6_9PROT|nr:hypothetical protein GCM10017083_37920 [Thalassobaculum fulvum]